MNDFKDKGYVKLEGFINKETSEILYAYVLLAKKRLETIGEEHDLDGVHPDLFGYFADVNNNPPSNAFNMYGDLVFDTLLLGKAKQLEELTDTKLIPQYSFARLYETGSQLESHIDRDSCEVSGTLCLGYESDYDWPLWIEDKNKKEVAVETKPGDVVVYQGSVLKHWRQKFKGKNHAQVFFHFTRADGNYAETKFDGRKALGMLSTMEWTPGKGRRDNAKV